MTVRSTLLPLSVCAAALLGLSACPLNEGDVDGGLHDAGLEDGGPGDAGLQDAGHRDAGESDAGRRDAGDDDGGQSDAGPAPDGLSRLDSLDDLILLADELGAVKYLAPVEGAEPHPPLYEECAFQNTERYPYHLPYLQAQPGGEEIGYQDYLALVLRRATRVWWGGGVHWQPDEEHPLTNEPGVLVFTLYTEDSLGNRLVPDDVREVHAILSTCAPAFEGALAFVPSSNEQRLRAMGFREELTGEGIAILLE